MLAFTTHFLLGISSLRVNDNGGLCFQMAQMRLLVLMAVAVTTVAAKGKQKALVHDVHVTISHATCPTLPHRLA